MRSPSPLLLLALGCAAPAPPSVTAREFEYIGPGSMGRFVDYKLHPTVEGLLLAVADVGGAYLSLDGGESWDNVTGDLPTNGVWSLGIVTGEADAEHHAAWTRVVLGTDAGLYYSPDLDSDSVTPAALRQWSAAAGVDIGDERPDEAITDVLAAFHGNRLTLPIGALTVDPQDPSRVWAGITAVGQMNLAQNPKDPYSLQRFDRWKVYRSTDGGQRFEPALRFSEPVPAFVAAGYDSDGDVFSILVNPEDSGSVLVASDRGLYRSLNADAEDADGDGLADLVWQEIGTEAARTSEDLGMSWSDSTPACSDWEVGSAATSWCLPIQGTATVEYILDPATGWPTRGFESHPNLRSLTSTRLDGARRLYVTVWDRGHADDAPEACDAGSRGDSFTDTNLEWYRGGVYASDDDGDTWTWLLTDTGAPGADPAASALIHRAQYRCDASTAERNSTDTVTFFPDVEAPPEASVEQLVVAALGVGRGIWTYQADPTSPWTYETDPDDADFLDRFEGGRPLNLSLGSAVEASQLLVDWDSGADGHPNLYFGSRGVLLGVWSEADGHYLFDHLGNVYLGERLGLPAWSGTGLDDAVVWDVVEVEDTLYVGVSDGSLLSAAATEDGLSYISLGTETWTPNWSDDPADMRKDETHAVAWDADRETLYASNVVTATAWLYSIFADDGDGFRIIGGYGYVDEVADSETIDADAFNGLFTGSPLARMDMNDLLIIPPDADAFDEVRLLAATSDGLWSYSTARAPGAQWEQLCGSLTDGFSFLQINADFSLAEGVAFAVNEDRRTGGLLAIDLSDGSCSPIRVRIDDLGRDPIRYPTAVQLATDEAGAVNLVVGASFQSYVSVFSGPLDCGGGACTVTDWTWSFTADGLYEADDPRDRILSRFDVTAIAVNPADPRVVWASLGAQPGYDYYNPQFVLLSDDGGASFEPVDFEATDYNLPNRSMHQLEFSEDGSLLYAATRSSLYRMEVE